VNEKGKKNTNSYLTEIDLNEIIKEIVSITKINSSIIKSFGLALITTNAEGIITGFNTEAEKLLGYRSQNVVGETSILSLFTEKELINEADRLTDQYGNLTLPGIDVFRMICESSENVPQEWHLIKEDSCEINLILSLNYLKDSDQNNLGFIFIALDNTSRKETEMLLRMQNVAFENFAIAVMITDKNGNIVWGNKSFETLTGYSPSEAIGKNARILNSGKMVKEFFKELWDTILSGIVWKGELINKRKNGSLYHEEQIITPLFDELNRINRFISLKINIDARKEIEINLKESKDILIENLRKEKELNELKSKIVSITSHEFRTPLASILLACDGLLAYSNRMDQSQIIDKIIKIKNNSQLLSSIVNDVLDYSKIQSGKVDFNPENIDLIQLCRQTINSFNVDQDNKNRINFYSSNKLLEINIDTRLIVQAINNLVSNALKYSYRDTIIKVKLMKKKNILCLIVSNNGIGIPQKDQEHILKPFFRASNAGIAQGTGLGLNIAKESIEAHGGSISFKSIPFKQTSFTIHLPSRLITRTE